LKENKDIISQIQPYTKYLSEKPDYIVDLTVKLKSMKGSKEQCKVGNSTCNIEWNVSPAKVKMNEDSTPATVDWILTLKLAALKIQDMSFSSQC
jgi:uncharacterized protein YdgA (DUF945 family)